jgi:thiol:disulfide interchange protein DsbA
MKLLMLLLSFGLSIAASSVQAIEAGKDYAELSPAQSTSAKKGQVEVLEFFWYGCPHCNALEPDINDWLKKKPKNVTFKRVPAILNDSWAAMARAYYALESLGKNDKLHSDIFHAFHVQRMDLSPAETFFDWAVTKGVDRKKLADAYNSFAVNTKVMRAAQLTRDYKLGGVPAIAVNGKFVTTVSMTGSHQGLFDTVDVLVAQELKRK